MYVTNRYETNNKKKDCICGSDVILFELLFVLQECSDKSMEHSVDD